MWFRCVLLGVAKHEGCGTRVREMNGTVSKSTWYVIAGPSPPIPHHHGVVVQETHSTQPNITLNPKP